MSTTHNSNVFSMDDKEIVRRIQKRRRVLKNACNDLKKHFVGIDYVIDKIERCLETWYCMPELLMRPVIICLFGPTGVGKTDLVRRLVKLLDFHDKFCEVEMMNKGSSANYGYHSSISSILGANPKIESGKPCVLLLDEIQNFRTLNEEGHELAEYKFRDIWTLLSDGKLPFHVDLDFLLQLLWEYDEKEKKEAVLKVKHGILPKVPNQLSRVDDSDDITEEGFGGYEISCDDEEDDCDDDGEPNVDPRDNDIACNPAIDKSIDLLGGDPADSYYEIKQFKNILRLPESLEEIAKWTNAQKKAIIIKKLGEKSLYEEVDYTKALVFISGNLDEAYEFARKTGEVDVDADIFHQLSLKINLLDIKKALVSRFKPEQIARFGNTQIIYPTLSRKSYETIIQRKTDEIVKNIKNRCGVEMEIDESIRRLIYENGVFPTQGTRPVFSTISEIIESPLPPFLLKSFSRQRGKIKIYYEKGSICGDIGGSIFKYPYSGALDKLKENSNKNIDRRVLNSVHEAGHAVVYANLFKQSPPQISSTPASQEIGGFIWIHNICGAKRMIEHKISTTMAGGVAERLVFGKEDATSGLAEDLHEATKMAGLMVKRYGMQQFASYIAHPQRSDVGNTDLNSANPLIEQIVAQFTQKAEDILKQNLALLQDTVDYLLNNKKLSPETFKDICAKHGLKIKIRESEQVIYSDYHNKYLSFKSSLEKS